MSAAIAASIVGASLQDNTTKLPCPQLYGIPTTKRLLRSDTVAQDAEEERVIDTALVESFASKFDSLAREFNSKTSTETLESLVKQDVSVQTYFDLLAYYRVGKAKNTLLTIFDLARLNDYVQFRNKNDYVQFRNKNDYVQFLNKNDYVQFRNKNDYVQFRNKNDGTQTTLAEIILKHYSEVDLANELITKWEKLLSENMKELVWLRTKTEPKLAFELMEFGEEIGNIFPSKKLQNWINYVDAFNIVFWRGQGTLLAALLEVFSQEALLNMLFHNLVNAPIKGSPRRRVLDEIFQSWLGSTPPISPAAVHDHLGLRVGEPIDFRSPRVTVWIRYVDRINDNKPEEDRKSYMLELVKQGYHWEDVVKQLMKVKRTPGNDMLISDFIKCLNKVRSHDPDKVEDYLNRLRAWRHPERVKSEAEKPQKPQKKRKAVDDPS